MFEGGISKPISYSEKQEAGKLKAIPIFRANDLYVKIFPEIEPAFQKGEEPNSKKIFEILKKYQNKEIIFDNTCAKTLFYETNLEEIPNELNFIPKTYTYNEKEFARLSDDKDFLKVLMEKWGVYFPKNPSGNTIDKTISKKLGFGFSPEIVKTLFDIAKQKNSNLKQILILTDHLTDHVRDFPREQVLPLLQKGAMDAFSIEAKTLPIIEEKDVKDDELIVLDRHNEAHGRNDLGKKMPMQTLLLPLETELFNYEQATGKKPNFDLVSIVRKEFEENKE
jgi:hypothetical protein